MQTLFCQPAASPSLFSAEGFVGLIFLITIGMIICGAVMATTSKRLVRCVAGLAVAFTGVAVTGDRHQIVGCDIHDTGNSGVLVNAGDRRRLIRGDSVSKLIERDNGSLC